MERNYRSGNQKRRGGIDEEGVRKQCILRRVVG